MTCKFAIIGTGMISRVHAEEIRSLPGAELTYVLSRDELSGREFADLYGCRYTTDPRELWASKEVNAVSVCTPSGTHAQWAVLAARHGKHVMVEKPLDISLAAADEAIRICRDSGVKLGVIFQLRFMEELRRAKRLLDDGVLGRLLAADADMKFYRPPSYYGNSAWKGTSALDGGGALINQGIHGVDLLLWLAGGVSEVVAETRTLLHGIEVEDMATAVVRFRSGASGVIRSATCIYPDHPQRLLLHGTRGTMEIVGTEAPYIRRLEVPDRPELAIADAGAPEDRLGEAHRRQFADFVESIAEDREPLVNGEEGRKSLVLVDAIYRSSRESRRMVLPKESAQG
ncbi:Gfo/Idh/MocA family protein [Cohnella zeiphila]|uniref:Gfo/Idh/MocA family oxidoreductase n=1 Tax=Cohnella zeiphila TaxID=2761120 RepID=A0A7X0VZZ0_9BACL|nr:Gfo/Idh/MocA family oxidoreductase [Cohnella zeiphila]MBB6736057.1 Gfo/Idh/MocA family oxidoreductase [Cohnella zeiphila]